MKHSILTKQPWKRIVPNGRESALQPMATFKDAYPTEMPLFTTVSQAQFLREYYPSGHDINSDTIYPDIWREQVEPIYDAEGNDTGQVKRMVYKELVPRFSFAFQQIIACKQVVHICGNDIQFELASPNPGQKEEDTFRAFRQGWLKKNMEVAFFNSVKSVKITADTACVGYLSNGLFGMKNLSYLNGDTLYPHFDSVTGELSSFARTYTDYDPEGNAVADFLEVWDDTYFYRYKRGVGKNRTVSDIIAKIFSVDGYTRIDKRPHGFPFCPVAYHRCDSGACWSGSQDSIDNYEMSFSQMAHNNQAYGEPIMVFQGENLDIQHDINGTIKSVSMGPDDKVDYLKSQSASESYMKQIDTLYKMIYEQSFSVIPPELKSGDLPAAALKILYSPAYEKASVDAKEFQPFLNQLVRIFSYGYGLEVEDTIGFANLNMVYYIEPYVHVNNSAVVADLATAVQNGFCSRRTASEKLETIYTTNAEWERIVEEEKQKQEAELIYEIETAKATAKQSSNEPTE